MLLSGPITAQDDCVQLKTLLKVIDAHHISPKDLDSTAYEPILKLFLNQLDSRSLYFVQKDIDQILNEANEHGICGMLSKIIEKSSTRIDQLDNRLKNLVITDYEAFPEALHFSSNDSLVLATEDDSLSKRWLQYMHYRILNSYFDSTDSIHADINHFKQQFKSKFSELRDESIEHEYCRLEKLNKKRQNDENYIRNLFFQSIATYYDPHTQYLDNHSIAEIENSLSERKLSLGLSYNIENNGKLIISGIQPGGPAWFSDQIHESDEITQISTGQSTLANFGCRDLKDVYNMTESLEPLIIKLDIKRADGTLHSVELTTTEIDNLDNVISSYLLKGESKIGYLRLPSFYSNFDYYRPEGCAEDLSKELLFRMNDNIDGLIIDLRNNGGGSLAEAIALIGLFVDYGTVGIIENREDLASIKDMHRGTIYDGPLIIMVNSLSASASELLASALQDYNRAIVVGSRSFGKATAQGILPLSKEEQVKVTTGRYYRINGSTLQAKGVTPSIPLPDKLMGLSIGEKNYPHHLKPKTVVKKVFTKKLEALPLGELQKRSQFRVDSSRYFQEISRFTNFIEPIVNKHAYDVTFESSYHFHKNWRAAFRNTEKISKEPELPYDIETNLPDHDIQIKYLKSDYHLLEAYYILTDYLEINK